MDERNTVNSLLLLGLSGIIIYIAAFSTFSDAMPDAVSNFVIPMACYQEGSQYYLATPTSLRFCNDFLDTAKNFDENTFEVICSYAKDADRANCLSISTLYGKRIKECTNIIWDSSQWISKTSSVSNADVEAACKRFTKRSGGLLY